MNTTSRSPSEGPMSADDGNFWEATCAVCGWTFQARHIRSADFRAELHATTTGHETDVDQCE